MFSYRWQYYMFHPWEIFVETGRAIKWAWQRVTRGWDDRVTWSIDGYLCRMMPQWIKMLKENKGGIPMSMFDEDQWDDKEHDWKEGEDERAKERWNNILDEIVVGFEAGYKIINELGDVYSEFLDEQERRYGKRLFRLGDEEDSDLYDALYEELDVEKRCAEEDAADKELLDRALYLLSENFLSFWD